MIRLPAEVTTQVLSEPRRFSLVSVETLGLLLGLYLEPAVEPFDLTGGIDETSRRTGVEGMAVGAHVDANVLAG
jgi:hypothetical protein